MAEYEFTHILDTAADTFNQDTDPSFRDGVVALAAELLLPDMDRDFAGILLHRAFSGMFG